MDGHQRYPLAAISILLVGLGVTSPRPAAACGGLFCSSTQPVNQAAERIIFIDHEDNTVTAVVQILYDGPAEQFSWLLPVPGEPEIGISSNVAFQRLQAATHPQYILTTQPIITQALDEQVGFTRRRRLPHEIAPGGVFVGRRTVTHEAVLSIVIRVDPVDRDDLEATTQVIGVRRDRRSARCGLGNRRDTPEVDGEVARFC